MTPEPSHPKPTDVLAAALQALPDRAAPATLEQRVLAELARRATLPWWRRSPADWPRDGRALVLLLLAGAVAGLGLILQSGPASQALSSFVLRLPWLALLQSVGATLLDSLQVVGDAVPRTWIYYAAAALVLSYGVLLGLGAAAYRAFIRPPTRFRALLP
jgi:hypothetical protein